MKLESLRPAAGSVKKNTRVGRGQGSGGGGTAKRGHKGAKSRSGYSQKRGFEGGQMPLQRRVPKFGFKNINRVEYKPINIDTIQALFDNTKQAVINIEFLRENGLVAKSDLVKILGRGEFTAKVEITAHAFSKAAAEAIVGAGGKAIVFGGEALEVEAKPKAKVAEPKKVTEPKVEAAPAKVEEAPSKVEAAPVKEVAPAKAASTEADDLTKVEGIGPKIAEVLAGKGITTFAQLAETSAETVSEYLAEAGSRFASHNPATWAEQAKLAAEGKWDELKELQDKLNGGRPE